MDLNDYMLDTTDLDWFEVLQPWGDVLPDEFTVWFANRLGEPFLVLEDGTVSRLDLEGGELECLATSRDALAEAIDTGPNATLWLRVNEIDRAAAAARPLETGECYGYRQPLILGGRPDEENLCVRAAAEYISFLGQMHAQIRDLPDGAEVNIRFRTP